VSARPGIPLEPIVIIENPLADQPERVSARPGIPLEPIVIIENPQADQPERSSTGASGGNSQPFELHESSDLHEAIQGSLADFHHASPTNRPSPRPDSPEEASGILIAHADAVVVGPERRISISRRGVYKAARRFFSKESFTWKTGRIMVSFVDQFEEDAADSGGLRREFFSLLLQDIVSTSGLLNETYNATIEEVCREILEVRGRGWCPEQVPGLQNTIVWLQRSAIALCGAHIWQYAVSITFFGTVPKRHSGYGS
jgi:hypothetical protein